MTDDSLITETVFARLALNRPLKEGLPPLLTEADNIEEAMREICAVPEDYVVIHRGRGCTVVLPHPANPTRGTHILTPRKGTKVSIQIVLSPRDNPRQWIAARYSLVHNLNVEEAGPTYWLEAECNPTTLWTGNNLEPVTIANATTGEPPLFPSSWLPLMQKLDRAGFDFLEELHQQVSGSEFPLYEKETRAAINRGDFELIRAQWCCYLPAPDISIFLQILTVLYAQTIASGDRVLKIANYFGLDFEAYADRRTHRIKGALLIKRHGKTPVWSVLLYDKPKRVAQMKQGKSLTATEDAVINNGVRLDMTAHRSGIMSTIRAAQRHLRELLKINPSASATSWVKAFLEETPKPTAAWLERAVLILSLVGNSRRIARRSFAGWLVPTILKDVLRLDTIATFTRDGLQELLGLADPVAAAWATVEKPGLAALIEKLAETPGSEKKSVIYKRRTAWIGKYGIDIAVPYQAYRDVLFYGSHSFATPENRAALIAAIGKGHSDETLRLLAEASQDFDAKRRDIVGATITSRPLTMSAKVARDGSPASAGAITGRAPAGIASPGVPAHAPAKARPAPTPLPRLAAAPAPARVKKKPGLSKPTKPGIRRVEGIAKRRLRKRTLPRRKPVSPGVNRR